MNYISVFGCIIFTTYGQLIIKWRIMELGPLPDEVSPKILFLIKALFDPFIFSGLFAAVIASLFWMAAMSKFDLSHAYPIMISGLIVLTSIAGALVFGESYDLYKTLGVILIITGVFLVTFKTQL